MPRCRHAVTDAGPPLMGFSSLQSVMCDQVSGTLGCPIPPWRRRFQLACVVFLRPPSPRTFAQGSSSRALTVPYRVSRDTIRPLPPSNEHLPWGSLAPSRHNQRSLLRGARLALGTASWASQAHFVPSSTFLTSSTASSSADVVGLFHPTATSGLRPPGSSPREKPHELVARRCPLVVVRVTCPSF
jgi:hypothetical protein